MESLHVAETISAVGILTVGSLFDLKSRKVPVKLLAVGMAAGIFFLCSRVWSSTGTDNFIQIVGESVGCFVPGLLLLLLTFITEKKVGIGDGIMLLLIGGMEGAGVVWAVFCLALFVQSLAAAVLLICKKANRKTALPFIPFMLIGRLLLFI